MGQRSLRGSLGSSVVGECEHCASRSSGGASDRNPGSPGRCVLRRRFRGEFDPWVRAINRRRGDVDLVVDLRAEQVPRLVATLQSGYYVDQDAVLDAVRNRASFNLIHLGSMVKVDLFVQRQEPFAQSEMTRARFAPMETDAGQRQVKVASPEDTVLRKLRWYRDGGEISERQWLDIQGVLKVQAAALDRDYLRTWAATLGVADLLTEALRQAGLEP